MSNESLLKAITESINNPIPKGTKKAQPGRPVSQEGPLVHVNGIGLMRKDQADKHYPGMTYTEYNSPIKENVLEESAFTAWKHRMEKIAHDRGMLLLYKTEGGSHGSTPEKIHAHLAIKLNGKTSPLNGTIGTFSNAENKEINEESLQEIAGAGMKVKELRKNMEKLGWYLDRSNGRHHIYKHPNAKHHIAVPGHSSEQSAPLMMKLWKQANDIGDKPLRESNDGVDHISMTVPLFIRCLEWAKETAKDDVELHKFVENIVDHGGVLSTDDYDSLLPKD